MRTPRSFGLVALTCLALGLAVGIGGAAVSDHITSLSSDSEYLDRTQQWDEANARNDQPAVDEPTRGLAAPGPDRSESERNAPSDAKGNEQARKLKLWVKWVTYFAHCGCSLPAEHNAPSHVDGALRPAPSDGTHSDGVIHPALMSSVTPQVLPSVPPAVSDAPTGRSDGAAPSHDVSPGTDTHLQPEKPAVDPDKKPSGHGNEDVKTENARPPAPPKARALIARAITRWATSDRDEDAHAPDHGDAHAPGNSETATPPRHRDSGDPPVDHHWHEFSRHSGADASLAPVDHEPDHEWHGSSGTHAEKGSG